MSRSPTLRIRIRGAYACFTRPEFKADRVSYDVITPSAARGILEAILWKPAIRWHIERIHVLTPIRFEAIKRNEVGKKASLRENIDRFFADDENNRQQRNSIVLRDVDYIVGAHFTLTQRARSEDNIPKFVEMFTRRLGRGQCFHAPYLGCREFAACVEPAASDPPAVLDALRGERELGLMLNDLVFNDETGSARPVFFEACMKDGCIEVPEARP
jgi:CRISPR-associated protein Cas5d